MMRIILSIFLLLAVVASGLKAQPTDPVLFSVKGTPVHVSEFSYIYTKTNQNKADFSEASLREYLDLYVKFKMKVQKARDMKYDTIPSLRAELEGYRRQVANSYLIDKEVTDRLVREAYSRMDRDAEISHLVINCKPNAASADTLVAYNKAMEALKKIKEGGLSFENAVMQYSEDGSKTENKGSIGWVTAMLPAGFYNMEVAVYNAKPGDLLGPIRTDIGYHLVKVQQFRPARGEMEIGHIMKRTNENPEAAKAAIDEIYQKLTIGASWDDICREYSDDKQTASKGGYLGFFGINRYQKSFEEAAFEIATDGAYSKPVQTQVGWHIIKRISAKKVGAFDTMKRQLTEMVKRDPRSEIARRNMISNIKKNSNFTENPSELNKWAAMQNDTFLTFRWKPAEVPPRDVLFSIGKQPYTVGDFEDYCNRTSRERMSGAGSVPVREMIDRLYRGFTDDMAMRYEEGQLDAKYPDFKSLMREYEEGNLLFFAAKELVWDKANVDTVGLAEYFNANLKNKYNWEERKVVSYYTVQSGDPKVIAKVQKLAKTKSAAEVAKKLNKKTELVKVNEKSFEKSKISDPIIEKNTYGFVSTAVVDEGKTASFFKIEKVIAPAAKTLNECKGYAVADYQDHLEKEWINNLKKEYQVKINEDVLNTLIKK